MMMAGWLAVFGVGAQPPIALVDVGPATTHVNPVDLEESSANFDLRAGLIFVDAFLNGVPGRFVIDTGAPGLVLNQKPENGGAWEGSGVTGCLEVEEVRVEHFALGNARFSALNAYKVDLGYLEENLNCKIDGLIGYEVLKEIEIILDYPNRMITMLPLRSAQAYPDQREGYLDFFLINHIPVVSAQLGKRNILLGVDTGAGANVLRTSLGKPYQHSDCGRGKVRGTDQQVKVSPVVNAPVVIEGFEEADKELDYLLMDLSHLHSDLDRPIDGLLGFPFFDEGKWSIHYGNQRIYFWKQ